MNKPKDIRCTISGNLAPKDSLLGRMMESSGVNEPVLKGLKKKQNWSDLEDLYQAVAEGFVEIGARIRDSVEVIKAAGFEETPELTSTIKGISSDLLVFTEGLVTIHKQHAGKTGDIEGENDLMLSLSVYTDYQSLNERFNAVVFPTMITIMDFTAEALEKLDAEQKAKALASTTEEVIKIGEGEIIG